MKQHVLIHSLILSLMLCSASSQAEITPCETIKDKVSAKLDGKGIENYTLKIVSKNTETTLRVVGVCEGGKKKIIYKKEKQT